MTVSAPPEDPPIPSLAAAVRRGVLLGVSVLTVVLGQLAVWNPWNVSALKHTALASGFLPSSVVMLSLCIEGLCTFRGCFPRLLLSLGSVAFALLTLIALWTAVGFTQPVLDVAAKSPNGRVQAVWVDTSGPLATSTGLVLRSSHGIDRHSTVESNCTKRPARGGVRFTNNRTLEITHVDGRVIRVHFDKNLNHPGVRGACR